jgi:hypothetical protein
VPTYTFVQPERYDEIKVSVRTPGHCPVIEGRSGIGNTTTITKVLADLGVVDHVTSLSACKTTDVAGIRCADLLAPLEQLSPGRLSASPVARHRCD